MDSGNETTSNLNKNPIDLVSDPYWQKSLGQIQSQFNFDLIGITHLNTPLTIDFYKKWLDQGFSGDMSYLQNHYPIKADPQKIDSRLVTAVTVGHLYYPTFQKSDIGQSARIALYAQNNDYHFWLKEKLNKTIDFLKAEHPDHLFLAFVDSGPILERDLAYKSGLGWFGKNTCLINSKIGSLFFIAEILTSLPYNSADKTISTQSKIEVHPDLCGKCTRCIDVCPTGALKNDRTLQADKCISYLTIESKQIPSVELRKKMGDWLFGCDLCQTVCPWNQKVFKVQSTPQNLKTSDPILKLDPDQERELEEFLKDILTSSNKSLQKKMTGSALHRAAGFGLKRNALIVIANRKIKSLEKFVAGYVNDNKLSELAKWTLSELL